MYGGGSVNVSFVRDRLRRVRDRTKSGNRLVQIRTRRVVRRSVTIVRDRSKDMYYVVWYVLTVLVIFFFTVFERDDDRGEP
jgi:hypothetical protein